MRNLRKLKVNADVTFATWILEWVGTLFLVFLWWLVASRGINMFLEFVIVVFYVILPHSFLMNTAHNKDRIVDEGLKNIIQNALHVPFDLSIFKSLFGNETHENGDAREEEIVAVDARTSKKLIDSSNVSEPEVPMANVKVESKLTMKQLDDKFGQEKPSSSNGICKTNGDQHLTITSMSDSEDDTSTILAENAQRLSIGKQLLTHMMKNVSNEERYLYYFLQLVDCENKVKCNINAVKNNAIIVIEEDENLQKRENSSTAGKAKSKSRFKSKKSKSGAGKLQVLSGHATMLSAEKLFDKISMRMEMLENFDEHCRDEESFNKFLNDLIDFEEGLIES